MNRKHFLYIVLPLVVVHFIFTTLNNFRESFLTDKASDLDDDILKMVKRYVGVGEIHQVETEDGYTLKIFHIPRRNPKGVMLLQHHFLYDARTWISRHNDSTAYLFWRAGYDVWLGNTRGNIFGRKHRSLQTDDRAFWNFSFHEMGYYDNLAITEYIKEKTNRSKIIYVGYSLGATSGLVYASTRSKQAADCIKLMIVIAPAAYVKQITSVWAYVLPNLLRLRNFFNWGMESPVMKPNSVHIRFCQLLVPYKSWISYMNGLVNVWTPDELEFNLADMATQTFDSESSWKVVDHFVQIYESDGHFRKYDYGTEKNLILYGTSAPPLYPLENIKLPLFHIYGEYDDFISIEDNEKLYDLLPKNSTVGKMMIEGFSHADLSPGRRSGNHISHEILRILEDI